MAYCQKCGEALPDGAAFCGMCGAKQEMPLRKRICPICKKEAPPEVVFCDQCGARLTPPADIHPREGMEPDTKPVPAEIKAVSAHKTRDTVILWCCFGLGMFSYLYQGFLFFPYGRLIWNTNPLLVLLFAIQLPCFLLAFTGFFSRLFAKKRWTDQPAFRRGILLGASCVAVVLSYLLVVRGEFAMRKIFILAGYSRPIQILTLQMIGAALGGAALAVGETDGNAHTAKIKCAAVLTAAALFSLFYSLMLYTPITYHLKLSLGFIGVTASLYLLSSLLVTGWSLLEKILHALRASRSTFQVLALSSFLAAAAMVLIFSSLLLAGGDHPYNMAGSRMRIFGLGTGLLLMVISAILWYAGERKAQASS